MSGPEERQRAVDLYFTTPMTMSQVVEHLGHPTRQRPACRLAADPRHAGHMAKPIIPLETRTKAIELTLGGIRGSRTHGRLGVSIGAVRNRVKTYREGGGRAAGSRSRNQGNALTREAAEAFTASKGRYGPAASGPCSRPVSRRRRSAGSWRRTRSSHTRPNDAGTVPTRARPRLHTATSPTATSPPKRRTGNACGHHRDQGPGREGAPLPDDRCRDGRIVAHTAGFNPNTKLADRSSPTPPETLPEKARPLTHPNRAATAGGRDGRSSWGGTAERDGLFAGQRGCGGFFRCMKIEAVYPKHREERNRDELLALVDEHIHWYNHERIKQSLSWISPTQYRQSQEMTA